MIIKIIPSIVLALILLTSNLPASDQSDFELEFCRQILIKSTPTDLPFELPFSYFASKTNDQFTFIHQRGYKVYDIANSQNEVAVIGHLNPCIGIAVTDSTKLVVFHKDDANSLEAMSEILNKELDLSCTENLYARIYTVRNDKLWNNRFAKLYLGISHTAEVKRVKDFLESYLGIARTKIPAQLYRFGEHKEHLGENLQSYVASAFCIAVRLDTVFQDINNDKQIKFVSIDPYIENVCHLNGQYITFKEFFTSVYGKDELELKAFGIDCKATILYQKIPHILFTKNLNINYYDAITLICQNRLDAEYLIHQKQYTIDNRSRSYLTNVYDKANFYRIN